MGGGGLMGGGEFSGCLWFGKGFGGGLWFGRSFGDCGAFVSGLENNGNFFNSKFSNFFSNQKTKITRTFTTDPYIAQFFPQATCFRCVRGVKTCSPVVRRTKRPACLTSGPLHPSTSFDPKV